MVKLIRQGVYFMEGHIVKDAQAFMTSDKREKAIKNTIVYPLFFSHATAEGERLLLKADGAFCAGREAVEAVQTAFAYGAERFALPVVLGGVSGEDFGTLRADENAYLSATALKAGADFVPAHLASEKEYLRDCTIKCGQLLFGGESAGLGALGTAAVGLGKGLSRALAGKSVVIDPPQTVAVYIKGKLRKGVGALDVALELLQALRSSKFAEGKLLEFFGTGVSGLSMETRVLIDEMMSLSGCLATVWETDDKTEEFFKERGREKAYKRLAPKQPAYYDWGVTVDLTRVEPMIALPSREILTLGEHLLKEDAPKKAELGYVSGGYETLSAAAEILRGSEGTPAFTLAVSPSSQSAYKNLAEGGALSVLLGTGAKMNAVGSAADAPSEEGFALCHAGAAQWQNSSFALMDACSIAATCKSGGKLASALDAEYNKRWKKCRFEPSLYAGVCRGKKGNDGVELPLNGSVSALPRFAAPAKNLLLKALFFSRETLFQNDLYAADAFTRCRSNPEKLARHTLEQRDALCLSRSAAVLEEGKNKKLSEGVLKELGGFEPKSFAYGGLLVAGGMALVDARAAVALRLFGCNALICKKETDGAVRSVLVDAGIIPLIAEKLEWAAGDAFYLEDVVGALKRGDERLVVKVFRRGKEKDAALSFGSLTAEERKILLAGGRIEYEKESE